MHDFVCEPFRNLCFSRVYLLNFLPIATNALTGSFACRVHNLREVNGVIFTNLRCVTSGHGVFVKELLSVKSGSRLRWNLGNLCQSIFDGGLIKNNTSLVLVICLKSTAVNMVICRPWDHSITTLASLLLQVISDNLLPSQSLPKKWSFAHLGRKQAWLCTYTTCGTFLKAYESTI